MITAKQAAEFAAKYLTDLVPTAGSPLLEEVELSPARGKWHITLSYITPEANQVAFLGVNRSYKIFEIDAENGEVISMKIRSVK